MDLVMYDSVNVTEIPLSAAAVAGYVNGRWPTYATLVTQFPQARKLSIAVDAFHDADCLDVERGDASPDEAPAWVKRQHARGSERPVVYCSVSQATTVLRYLALHGIARSHVRLWTAHYTGKPHRCSPLCRFGMWTHADATQYTDRALGRNLDASLVAASFFPAPAVSPAVRRHRLRAWILAQRKHGATWATLKQAARWRLWRRLGGR